MTAAGLALALAALWAACASCRSALRAPRRGPALWALIVTGIPLAGAITWAAGPLAGLVALAAGLGLLARPPRWGGRAAVRPPRQEPAE